MLESAARHLSPFLDDVVFIGGATVALWITDEGAPTPRITKTWTWLLKSVHAWVGSSFKNAFAITACNRT